MSKNRQSKGDHPFSRTLEPSPIPLLSAKTAKIPSSPTKLVKCILIASREKEGRASSGSKRESVTRFLASGFFHRIIFPQAPEITLGSFRIFSKIRGDIRKSRCTLHINDTGGKIATGVSIS